MNKKGFTLIEILVVLVLVSIIVVISIPSISDLLDSSKEKSKEEVVNMITTAAEIYASDYNIGLAEPMLMTTLCKNYLKCPIKDPITDNPITGYVYSKIDTANNDALVYELVNTASSPTYLKNTLLATVAGKDISINKYAGNGLYKWDNKYIFRGGITKTNSVGLATSDGYLTDTNSGTQPNNYLIAPWDTSNINCASSTNSCYRIVSINEDETITIVRDRSAFSSVFDNVHNTPASIYYSQPATNYGYSDLLENAPLPAYSPAEYRQFSFMYNRLFGDTGYEKTTIMTYSKMLEKIDFCLNKYGTVIGLNRADYLTSSYVKDSCDVIGKTGGKSVFPLKDKYMRLLYPEEFLNASTESTCTARGQYQCRNQNYIYTDQSTRTLIATGTYSWVNHGLSVSGTIYNVAASSNLGVRPVVTLRKNVIITGGTGSQANPYVIAN